MEEDEQKKAESSQKKPIGTMNIILIIVGIFLLAFTLKMISLFETYGMVPDTLVNCVFVALAGECGIMGWIKTSKEKNKDRRWLLEDRKQERENLLEDQQKQDPGGGIPLG